MGDKGREERLRALPMRPSIPKNPCPVGRKIISNLQMRQICGLDTRRSLDSTLQSQKSPNSSQMSQDSLFATPVRQGGSKLVSKASRRERLQEQRAYFERMERLLGPRDPNAKLILPKPVPLDESSADEYDEEIKENVVHQHREALEERERTVVVDDQESIVQEPANAPETSQMEVTAEEDAFAGSQGRYGRGCSTPKHVNNTLAPLRQIDVSAVSLDGSTHNRGVIRSESSEDGGEPMEVDEGDASMSNVFAQFKGNHKSSKVQQETSEQGGTFTVVKDTVPESKTFSIRRDDGTFTVNQNNDVNGGKKDEAEKNGSFVVKENLPEEAGTFVVQEKSSDAPHENAPEPLAPVLVHEDLPGPSRVAEKAENPASVIEEKKSFGLKRSGFGSLLQNLSSIPSPGSTKFGYMKRPVRKVGRLSSPEKPRRRDTVSPNNREKTIEMSNVFNADPSMADLDLSSMIEAFTDPRERYNGPPDTPKSTISRPVSRLSRSNSRLELQKPSTPSTPLPNYAKHTAASRNRSLFVPQDEESDRTASFNEIDPDDMVVHQGMKSGFRPRQSMAARKALDHLRTMNKSLAEPRNESAEERRRQFLERRGNGESRANQGTPLRAVVEENKEQTVGATDPEEPTEQEDKGGQMNVDPTLDALHQSARNLSLQEAPEEPSAPKENVTATVLIGAEQPLPMDEVVFAVGNEFDFAPMRDDDDEVPGAYEDDEVDDETALVVRRPQQQLMNSLFSRAPETPMHHRRRGQRGADVTIVDEDSMVEENESQGESTEMVLKPRRLVRPESPEDAGLRRSKRNRIAPVRYYLGEQPVYENSPNRGPRLVGTSKVVIRDHQSVKMRTTNPVKVVDRMKKAERKKKERRHRDEDSD